MNEDKKYTVYKHTAPNGKVYIGITKQKPEQRWANGNGYKHNEHFYRAIQNYDWENIEHEIVENGLTKEQACNMEIELIAKYDATNPKHGYNNTMGGETNIPSKETRRKLSESHKGVHLSAEHRRKIGEANKGVNHPYYGKHLSAEHRQKLSESHKGASHPNYGKHLSAETRRKISEGNKCTYLNNPELQRKRSESKKGVNNPNYNKHPSAETLRKRSESLKRTYLNPELRQKMSELNKGRNAKAVICVETRTVYNSATEAGKELGLNRKCISRVCHGDRETTGGYHWKYVEM